MISNQILQATLDGLKAIARVDLAITDPEGRTVVSTGDIPGISKDAGEFAQSGADSQEIKGNQYFKIYDDQSLEYVLAVAGTGEDVYTLGKMAAFQVQSLSVAYRERFDKDNFIKNLILDNMLLVDIYNRAKKLHIVGDIPRVVILTESSNTKDINILETVRNFCASRPRDFVTAVDETDVVVVMELEQPMSRPDMQEAEIEETTSGLRDALAEAGHTEASRPRSRKSAALIRKQGWLRMSEGSSLRKERSSHTADLESEDLFISFPSLFADFSSRRYSTVRTSMILTMRYFPPLINSSRIH